MLKKLSQYFFESPDEIGFDNYMVLVLSFLTAILGALGTLINIILNLGLFTIFSTLIPTIIFTPIYLYSKYRHKYLITKYVLTIFSLILLNFQWFINFGSKGPILYLFVILESFIIIFFEGRSKVFLSILIILNVTGLFCIEQLYPALLGDYSNASDRLLDLYFSLLIYLFISMFLLDLALRYYKMQKEKAQMSDKLKTAFLANMSHEIRTPMNGILGFAELLKKPNLTGEQQQKYIGVIQKSGNRMLNIINNIIDISKIESGIEEINIQDTNINEQVEYIYVFFKPEVENKGIQLLYHIGLNAQEAIIKTDREKIYAILTNLVKNAIKFTNAGSIEFGYKKKDAFLEFFVKDTGIGIPVVRQEAIFERFIQADINDEMARQGAGLGLSITKAYVEMLGGKIWVESDVEKGSIFYFTIPYISEAIENHRMENVFSSDESGIKHNKNLKILIAEDDETSEMLVEMIVEEVSKEIIKVQTGTEAVNVCRSNPDIDLILMDIKMPSMDGYEATRKIREFNKDVVIIAQTAFGLSGDREKSIEAGCNDYVSKPINNDQLLALIQKHFSN
jgi:signal transduction histidine kinase/CheY-like chemotaxis protein